MSKKTVYDRIVDWFDVKFGFAKTPLKPIPDFTLNPIYWLGALLAVTFALQAMTGMFMLLYYVPTPAEAYSSTMFIINSVPLGQLVETMHLYTAYAMILLTFLHLVRNFFGSAHKGNRDLMWLAGFVLAGVVVSFGVTGYLLPWTVISKSATDVAIGFVSFLPTGFADLAKFFLVGTGSDSAMLNNFLHVHTVMLPLALIAFLGLKIYMYEVHGPAYVSAYGKPKVTGGKYYRWFPKVFLFGVMLVSAYVAILLAAASFAPLSLPPAFSPATAGNYVVQPDWYLLWVYQILKIEAFEGPNGVYAIVAVAVVLALLFLLPFYDRSRRRDLGQRPLFATAGAILVVELVALTVWGYLTPGQTIPSYQAVLVLGGSALATAAVVWIAYKVRRGRMKTAVAAPLHQSPPLGPEPPKSQPSAPVKNARLNKKGLAKSLRMVGQSLFTRFTAVFVVLLAVSSVTLSWLVNMLPNLTTSMPAFVGVAAAFGVSMYFMCAMLRRFVLAYEAEAHGR
ncbi:MAG: cytochrome bc complex cytochrome b subunit [Candidatus Bathyarchaeia archaeon]